VSDSCCLSRPIKSEHEKELLVLFEEAILIYALALSLAWSGARLALKYVPAFLAGGVSKRNHCAVGRKNCRKYLEYVRRYIRAHMHRYTYMYIHVHICRKRKRDVK